MKKYKRAILIVETEDEEFVAYYFPKAKFSFNPISFGEIKGEFSAVAEDLEETVVNFMKPGKETKAWVRISKLFKQIKKTGTKIK